MGDALKKPNCDPGCGPSANTHNSTGINCKPSYAGFWMRLSAYLIDSIIIVLVFEIYTSFFPPNYHLAVAFYLFYKVLLESSKYQGTLGKGIMGIKITNYNGERITVSQATKRYLGHVIGHITFFIGFIIIGFTLRKQGVQDYLGKTLVIKYKQY